MMDLHRLLQGLRDQDWWSRRQTITSLILHPEHEYREFLEESIRNHEDADIRNASMEVFKALGVRALPSIVLLSKDPDPEVRLFSANILCEIRDPASLPVLFRLMKDGDINVRAAAAEATGKTGDGRSLRALKEALSDDAWVATAAVMAIGDIGGEAALGVLYGCLENHNYREIAIAALEKAGNRDSIGHLSSCFEYEELKGQALKAIIRIAERERVRPQPEYFIRLVPMLIEMLDSADQEERQHAFMALCWSKDIMGLSYILEAIRDEGLQEYAIEGLLSIGRKAVCSIVDELKDSSGSQRVILAKVLGMIGEDRALLQFAEDEDPEVRVEVALSLGSVNIGRAVTSLSRMLDDPYEEVRLAAGKSLARLREKGFSNEHY